MGLINIFKTRFGKKIYINEDELVEAFCLKVNLKRKRVKINTLIEVPQNCCAISFYKGKPCDMLPSGEIALNGASLPILFKYNNYQETTKKTGKLSNYFEVQIYALSLNLHRLEFDVGRFTIKDEYYGKQKVNISLKVDIKISDPMKFMKVLIHEHPNLKRKKVKDILCNWLSYDVVRILKKNKYSIDDYMMYTQNINAVVSDEMIKRFNAVGLEINVFGIEDVVLPEDLVREIEANREVSLEIHSKLSDFEAVMQEDGSQTPIGFTRNQEQTEDSVFENKYHINVEENQFEDGVVLNKQSYFEGGSTSYVRICEQCGREVPAEANFCPYCASKMRLDVNTCANCGANNIPDADFCYNCGNKLS